MRIQNLHLGLYAKRFSYDGFTTPEVHMRNLRWTGFVFSLLIVGVLGGLLAPLPSEASGVSLKISVNGSPDETINFDALSGNTVANGVACKTSNPNDSANYNICYKIKTWEEDGRIYGSATRKVKIENAIGTDGVVQDARLLINDCDGTGCLEKMVLTGLKIVPCASNVSPQPVCSALTSWDASLVTVKLTYHNKMDFLPNLPTDGSSTNSYRFQLSIVGVFKETASGTCTSAATLGCPVQDEMHMWGRGIFCTSSSTTDCPSGSTGTKQMDSEAFPVGGGGNAANKDRTTCTASDNPLCRMYLKAANAAAADVRFDKSQAGTNFPGFRCNNGLSPTPKFDPFTNTFPGTTASGKRCTADATVFIEFKLYGPDTVNMDGSPRVVGGNCGTPQAPPCDCTGKKQCLDAIISDFVDDEVAEEKKVQFGIPDVIDCDKDTICKGIINIAISVTPEPATLLSFPFKWIGPDGNNVVVKTDTNTADPLINVFTGPGSTVRILAPDYDNPDWPIPPDSSPNNPKFYSVDQAFVTNAIGISVPSPFVVVHSCPGGHKAPVEILEIPFPRDTDPAIYNINFHIHKSTSPGILCE